jgi:N-acetylmuramoyl-L-alanine amidase
MAAPKHRGATLQLKGQKAELIIQLQTKFVQIDDQNNWNSGWPAGNPPDGATCTLEGTSCKETQDGKYNKNTGITKLDVTDLKSGAYTLVITPATANTWNGTAQANTELYKSDPPKTCRYRPVKIELKIEIDHTSVKVTEMKVVDPVDPSSEVHAMVDDKTANTVKVDWRPKWIRSKNQASRTSGVDLIVLHRTGVTSTIGSPLNTFMDGGSSAHYLVDIDGFVLQLVEEVNVAWHAGYSFWKGNSSMNNNAIGIEIVNIKHAKYTEAQYVALISLVKDIMSRHSSINRHGIVGHSDVETMSKTDFAIGKDRISDPGLEFDWQRLMDEGLSSKPDEKLFSDADIDKEYGTYFEKNPKSKFKLGQEDKKLTFEDPTTKKQVLYDVIAALQDDLRDIGYSVSSKDGITSTKIFDQPTWSAVGRFQRHFMPGKVKQKEWDDQTFDRDTAIAIKRVLKDRSKP